MHFQALWCGKRWIQIKTINLLVARGREKRNSDQQHPGVANRPTFQWAIPALWNGLFWIWEWLWSSSKASFHSLFCLSFFLLSSPSPSHLFQILTFLNFYISLQSLTNNEELRPRTALGCSRSLWLPLKSLSPVVEKKVMVMNVWRTVTWELCSHILHSTHKCKVNTYQQPPQNPIVNILHTITVTSTRILQILLEYFLSNYDLLFACFSSWF